MNRRLLLVGAGHAHAQVLKGWAESPLPGVELVVVSPHALAPYSGMVPGWLAGTYDFDDIVIDFSSLCERAGARWVPAELLRLDPRHRHVELSNGERLRYDLLSLNVGSTLTPPTGDFSARVLPMRPLAELRERYGLLIAQWRDDDRDQPFRITAVGGGADMVSIWPLVYLPFAVVGVWVLLRAVRDLVHARHHARLHRADGDFELLRDRGALLGGAGGRRRVLRGPRGGGGG